MITNNEIDIVKRNLKNKADSTFDEIWMLKINRRYRNHFTMNNGKKINGNIEYVILEFFNDDDNTIKSYLEDPTLVSLPDGFKINDIVVKINSLNSISFSYSSNIDSVRLVIIG